MLLAWLNAARCVTHEHLLNQLNLSFQLFTVSLSSLSPFDLYIHLVACMLQLNIQSTTLSLYFHQKILVFAQLVICSLPFFTEFFKVLGQLDKF